MFLYAQVMANIILIAGTYHGGWYWGDLAGNLRELGHDVYAPTLDGLGLDSPSAEPIDLDRHIQNVIEIIDSNKLEEVTLVGWSYGGMVITGVPSRTSAKIRHLVYLDAAFPKSGEAEFDLIPAWLRDKQIEECADGLNQFPSKDFLRYESRMKPHPIGTKQQPIVYDELAFAKLPKTYVIAGREAENGVFARVVDRIKGDSSWRFKTLDAGHDLFRDAPNEVEALLVEILE